MNIEIPDAHPAAQALKIISGDRQESYGPPERNFERIAQIWSVIFGVQVTPRQVALAMIGLKIARDSHAEKDDNVVDTIGYAMLLGEIAFKSAPKEDKVIDVTDQLIPFEPGEAYLDKSGGIWLYNGFFPERGLEFCMNLPGDTLAVLHLPDIQTAVHVMSPVKGSA
jgi:hypothetical protein